MNEKAEAKPGKPKTIGQLPYPQSCGCPSFGRQVLTGTVTIVCAYTIFFVVKAIWNHVRQQAAAPPAAPAAPGGAVSGGRRGP